MKNQAKLNKMILFIIFFLSGVSALIYQVIWIRMLGQIFGLTIFAVSTVLTAFMAGLALGSFFFGKLIDKQKNQLLVFCILEFGIGVFALLFPLLLKLVTGIYVAFTLSLQPDLYINSIIRFVFAFLLLLVPTTLMGGTLPVLSKYYIKNMNRLGGNVGNLYSINNLGAVIGCFISSFVLIQIIGLHGNIYIAACINICIAAVIFLIRDTKTMPADPVSHQMSSNVKKRSRETKPYPPYILRLVLWVFAIEGFTTLSYEVIWTRVLLGISFDRSVYFYSTVIITFIFGLSLGSFIVARFVDRKKNLVFLLGIIEVIIGIVSCVLLIFFVQISGYFSIARLHYTEPWILSLGMEYFIFFLMMITPAILMGLTFPIVAKVYTTNIENLGRKLGLIGCLDTIGSIFGSFIAGFVLIPCIGVVNAVIFTAFVNILIGLTLIIFNPRSKTKVKAFSVAIVLIVTVIVIAGLPQEQYFKHWQTEEPGDRLLFYKEGLGSTVAVSQKFDGVKELAIDGAVTAIAEYGDLRVHKLLAYLPYLLCKKPENALVVGFGMGITCQSLVQDDIKEITCIEICSEIIDGSARYFEKENKDVLDELKLNMIIEDGRSYMAMTNDKYDIITTNAVHPRLSINIYTKEFYELCRSKLTDNGVMCQWMATNWMSEYEYKMLLKSFVLVFQNTTFWISNIGHVLLVGTPEPLSLDFQDFKRKLAIQKIKSDLGEVHLDDPFSFLALYGCNADELNSYLDNIPPNTDNYPLPEFSKYIKMTPNLNIIDEYFNYKRDIGRFVVNWNTEEDKKRLSGYVDAEKAFLRARYAFFYSRKSDIIKDLQKAIASNPYNFSFHKTLGDAYSGSGDYENAVIAYKNEIKLDNDNPLGYNDLAYAYFKQGEFEKALLSANKAIDIDRENGFAHYLLSIIYRFTYKFDKAAEELEKVVKYNPGFSQAFFELGEVYYGKAQYQKAKKAFMDYLKYDKNNKDARNIIKKIKKMGY